MPKFFVAIPMILLPVALLAHGPPADSVQSLIKNLGSTNFQVRQAATTALRDRPEAAPALREALRSSDLETRCRAAELLDHFDRLPIRLLKAAVKEGRVDRAIELLSAWPAGKYEPDAWALTHGLVKKLVDLDQEQGRETITEDRDRVKDAPPTPQPPRPQKIEFLGHDWGGFTPDLLNVDRITESTNVKIGRCYFVRAGEVDLDTRRVRQLHNTLDMGAFIVAARTVRLAGGCSHVVLAGGSVELIDGDVFNNTIVISGGDVTLNCLLWNSLVIARGKVISTRALGSNRIISGKSVTHKPATGTKNIIIENEANPLGFIRWSQRASEKSPPKSK